MKRVITLLLALVMVIGLTACGGNDTPVAEAPNATQPTANTPDAAPEAAGEEYLRLNWEYINSTKSGFQAPALMGNYLDTNLIWNNLIRMDVETGEVVYELADVKGYQDLLDGKTDRIAGIYRRLRRFG